MQKVYCYGGRYDLSAGELFFWIMVDKTLEQLGVKDVGAVVAILLGQPILSTKKPKPKGAIKGTSFASKASRGVLDYRIGKRVLPTIVGTTIPSLRIRLVNNIGAFVGRTVPVVGWVILAYDVAAITKATIIEYNRRVSEKDQCPLSLSN